MENFEIAKDLFFSGLADFEKGNYDEAEVKLRKSLELVPDRVSTLTNLSATLIKLEKYELAKEFSFKAILLDQNTSEAWLNLGLIELHKQNYSEAIDHFDQAIQLRIDYAEAWSNKGAALRDLSRCDEALSSFEKAISFKPDYAEAWSNKGATLNDFERYDEALVCYEKAININPDYAEAWSSKGVTLQDLKLYDEAFSSYEKAISIKPGYAVVRFNLGNALMEIGQLDGAVASFRWALKIKPDYTEAQGNLLFTLNYTGRPPEYHLEEARKYGRMVFKKVSSRFSAWLCTEQPQRLRVGIVSGDLYQHAVGHFLEGLLAHIDPARLELIAYPTHHKEDELTTRIRPYFSAWKPLFGKSDEDAARLIHADGVHVLLDVSGHTAHNRLPIFAWKPAPVQVTWLGLPATTGVAEMDYVLGDPHAIPPEFESHFTETVWRMPESYLCLTVPASPVNVVPLPALAAGYVTFGSFNNLTKMTDTVVAVWARILESLPNSRLLLKTKQLSDPVVCEKTRQRFAACGIAPERLLLSGTIASRDDHLAAYNKVDIALDTFPYPGVTTSVEALWMGVPVLSLRGDRFMSRTAESIAHNAGLPGWVATDEDDYVAKAVAFASDLERLAALRAGLRQQVLASPLFDAPRFARNFEDALWGMWHTWCEKQPKGNA